MKEHWGHLCETKTRDGDESEDALAGPCNLSVSIIVPLS